MIWRLARVTMTFSAAVLAITLVGSAQSKDPFVVLEDEPCEE